MANSFYVLIIGLCFELAYHNHLSIEKEVFLCPEYRTAL